jgi:MFS family permease
VRQRAPGASRDLLRAPPRASRRPAVAYAAPVAQRDASLPDGLAAALVFGASGAVLVLEILAVRLLAPYVGLSLETYTTIIGVVLAGIAGGAAWGGRLADRVDPRRLVGLLLMAGGVLAALTVPLVRVGGEALEGDGAEGALLLGLVAFLPPAAVLSAVTPVTAKLQLQDLGHTGAVVGRLSAWATAGALSGTFATGFVLVPLLPVRVTVVAVAALLIAAGAVAAARSGAARSTVVTLVALGAGAGAAGAATGSRCELETAYFCARIVADADRPSGRTLWLDDLRHSYVDLRDPRHLEFDYARWIGDVVDATAPRRAVFIGGAGFSLPRYVLATQPGARVRVLEIDGELVDFARERLALRVDERLAVRVGDARITLRDEPTATADLVVGDAFAGRAVPWHLATREFLRDVRRVLRHDGIYAMNLIDGGDLRFARAMAATLRDAFDHVTLVAKPGPAAGNLVLLASEAPIPAHAVPRSREASAYGGAVLARLVAGAHLLRDEHAPADQLLAPRR